MINHTVLWTLKDEALGNKKEENLILMKEKLLVLKDKIDEIIEISVGINSVETPSSYDFILNVLFENKDDLDSYIVNKYHKEVGTFVREVVDKRVSIDYEV
ncbi:MAG: Dabb family protein [Clostridia bacterium]|nr:Dabb family protein [Clostridia bacterium]